MQLEKYRKQLDKIDKEIIRFLSERMKVVAQVGEYKKQNNIAPLDPARWQKVLESRKQIASDLGVSEDLIAAIWEEIHQEALKIEYESISS